jgi:hypothetical protein
MKLGFQPVSLTAQFYGNAVHPVNTPSWTMRLQIAFLFPTLTRGAAGDAHGKETETNGTAAADQQVNLILA